MTWVIEHKHIKHKFLEELKAKNLDEKRKMTDSSIQMEYVLEPTMTIIFQKTEAEASIYGVELPLRTVETKNGYSRIEVTYKGKDYLLVLTYGGYGGTWSCNGPPYQSVQACTDCKIISYFMGKPGKKGEIKMQEYMAMVFSEDEDTYLHISSGGNWALTPVEIGKFWKIREYDGHEYVEILDMDEWYKAGGGRRHHNLAQ